MDEFDRYEDNQTKRAAKRSGTAAVMKGCVKKTFFPKFLSSGLANDDINALVHM